MRIIRPSALTWVGAAAIVAAIAGTGAYLLVNYTTLPDLLAVRFNRAHLTIGWQYKTYWRVMTPVFLQMAIAGVSCVIATLLLTRAEAPDHLAADVRAAGAAAEAIVLFAAIWTLFQGYVALSLVDMWLRDAGGWRLAAASGLGDGYTSAVLAGVALTIVVAARGHARLGSPAPRPLVAAHWRWHHLYRNPADPALFVPTRDGGRWTLNFGRPVAAVLIAVVLGVGIVAPVILLTLALR